MHWRYGLFLDDGNSFDAKVFGLTDEVQNRYVIKCIGDMVYFLTTGAYSSFGSFLVDASLWRGGWVRRWKDAFLWRRTRLILTMAILRLKIGVK